MNDKIIEKLRKIKSLADEGYKGEASAARALLEKQLKKYNLSLNDLEGDEVKRYEIRFKFKYQRKLLKQIIAANNLNGFGWKHSKRKTIGFDATPMQYAEVSNMFDFYVDLWNKEQALFYRAFLHKHDIFRPETQEAQAKRHSEQKLTNEEKEKIYRMGNMMEGLSSEKYETRILRLT